MYNSYSYKLKFICFSIYIIHTQTKEVSTKYLPDTTLSLLAAAEWNWFLSAYRNAYDPSDDLSVKSPSVGACRFSTAARRPTPPADTITVADITANIHRIDSTITTELKSRRIIVSTLQCFCDASISVLFGNKYRHD